MLCSCMTMTIFSSQAGCNKVKGEGSSDGFESGAIKLPTSHKCGLKKSSSCRSLGDAQRRFACSSGWCGFWALGATTSHPPQLTQSRHSASVGRSRHSATQGHHTPSIVLRVSQCFTVSDPVERTDMAVVGGNKGASLITRAVCFRSVGRGWQSSWQQLRQKRGHNPVLEQTDQQPGNMSKQWNEEITEEPVGSQLWREAGENVQRVIPRDIKKYKWRESGKWKSESGTLIERKWEKAWKMLNCSALNIPALVGPAQVRWLSWWQLLLNYDKRQIDIGNGNNGNNDNSHKCTLQYRKQWIVCYSFCFTLSL